MHKTALQPAYELDIAPDGERWRYRKRWTSGLRRFLPAFWHATDETGVRLLKQELSGERRA